MASVMVLFLLTAAAGVLFAVLESRGHRPPLKVTSLHGLAGVLAIVLLVAWDVGHPGHFLANSAAVVSILTALGGSLLFVFRASRQPLPLFVVLLHGAFALTAITLLGLEAVRG